MQTEMERRDMRRLSNEESNRITRECLQRSLLGLMKEQDFEKISKGSKRGLKLILTSRCYHVVALLSG